jgi:LysR family nitrogen assimilation transcriptional regulator
MSFWHSSIDHPLRPAAAIDLDDLAAFCSIAEHGSLTRAAAALGVAQSVLSRRTAALETELGGRLFHRTGRGVVPTELGARLQPRARNVLAEAEALKLDAHGAHSSPAGVVEIALVPAVARPLVSALCSHLRERYPRIQLRAQEAYSGQVEEWLANGRIDLGLFNRYGRGRVRDAELVLTSDVVLVASRKLLDSTPATIAFRALQGLPLVLPPAPNALVSIIRDLAQRQHMALAVALEASSALLIRDAVAAAGLCTLVPVHLARRDYPGAEFVVARIVKPGIVQRTWLALTTQRPASIAARTVARVARELAPAVGERNAQRPR